ncbi:hypothetical protein ACFLXK_00735 [Chloroflexota bacterium]
MFSETAGRQFESDRWLHEWEMSKFIDKLNRLSRGEPQPIGFRTAQSASPKPQMQLVASLAQDSVDSPANYATKADAGLLHISELSSGAKTIQKMLQAVPGIPWGGWLQDGSPGEIKQMTEAGCDFVVFPATNTPLAILQNDEVGKILEVEASLAEGLLRSANELPIDAVLIADTQRKGGFLTWQHLMLFQRFADLLTKPLLVSIPESVTADELQALWEAGVSSVIIEVRGRQSQNRLKELRQIIDKLPFMVPRKREKTEPLLPRVSAEMGMATAEEEEEEEE